MDKLVVYVCTSYTDTGHVGRIYINRPIADWNSNKCITFDICGRTKQYSSCMNISTMDSNKYLEPLNDMNIGLVRKFYGNNFDTLFETLRRYV